MVEGLKFLVADNRVELNAFVIMSNHIHLIWQPISRFSPSNIQASFMKFTAKQLKRSLIRMIANTTIESIKYYLNDFHR